jgi:dTMP kinase
MKFAVIEGLDGSGKSTQINMLHEYLKKNNIPFEYIHFPRTDSPVYGDLVARFLRGELGDNESVNPYLVALIYAGDRNDAANLIRNWQKNNVLVLVDRYVYSNIAYQCAKLEGWDKKEELKNWILNLEYSYNQIPKPDVNIFLNVPFEFTKSRLTASRSGDDRDYLQGKADIHEANLDFQGKVREMYLHLSKSETSLQLVDCSDNGQMLPPDAIFNKILDVLIRYKVIS